MRHMLSFREKLKQRVWEKDLPLEAQGVLLSYSYVGG